MRPRGGERGRKGPRRAAKGVLVALWLAAGLLVVARIAPAQSEPPPSPAWDEVLLGFRQEFRAAATPADRVRAVQRLATVDRVESASLLVEALRATRNGIEDLTLRLGEKTRALDPYRKDSLTEEQWAERDRLEAERIAVGKALDGEETVDDAIRDALAGLRDPDAVRWLAATGLADESVQVRAACALALGAIGLPSTIPALAGAVRDPDPRVRTAAIDAVGSLRALEAVGEVARALGDEQFPVRAAAVQALASIGGHDAVAALVAGIQGESGRLLLDMGRALEKLTGRTFRDNPPAWRDWWEANRDTFESKAVVRVKRPPPRRAGRRDEKAPRVTYHGITTTSSRIVFLLDISDSMNDPARSRYLNASGKSERGTSKRSKFHVAREELKRAIRALDGKDRFDIIVYNHLVRKWQDRLVPALPSNKALAIAFLDSLKAAGGTNIFDSLEEAFHLGGFGVQDRYYRSKVDTLFLMSDGAPSAGRIVDTDEILAEVDRVNRLRKIQIHAIAIGHLADRDFLRELARRNDGQFIDAF